MRATSRKAAALAALLVSISVGIAPARAADTLRVAIVAAAGGGTAPAGGGIAPGGGGSASAGGQVDAVAALMLAQGVEGAQFVERAAISKVLSEQQLSAMALTSPDAAVKVGKLLGADIFVVLEAADPKATALGAVIFDVNSGVRLADIDLNATESADDAAKTATDALASAIHKRANPAVTHTLALLAVRNVNLPPELEGLCSTVSLLVQRGLLASPDVAVLERQRLENMNTENALPTAPRPGAPAGATSPLLTAAMTVDLQISRNPDKSFAVKATLKDRQDKLLGDLMVEAPAADAAAVDLAQEAVSGLLEKIKAAPAARGPAPDPKREAQRFAMEADAALRNKELYRALGGAEAACALDASSDTNVALLTKLLAIAARDRVMPGEITRSWSITIGNLPAGGNDVAKHVADMPAMFSIGRRALVLRQIAFERWLKTRRNPGVNDFHYLETDRYFIDLAQARYYEKEPSVREDSMAYRRDLWNLAMLMVKDRQSALKSPQMGTVLFQAQLDPLLLELNCSADTADNYANAALPLIQDFWDYEKAGHVGQGQPLSKEAGSMASALVSYTNALRKWTYPDYTPPVRQQVDAFLDKLESDPDAGVKATILALRKDIPQMPGLQAQVPDSNNDAYDKARDQFKASLAKPSAGASDLGRQREEIYGQWYRMITTTRFSPQSGGIGTPLLDYLQTMIDRREVTPRLFGNVFPTPPIKVDKPELIAHAFRQLADIASDPKTIPFTGTRAGVLVSLQKNALALVQGSYPRGTSVKSLPADLQALIGKDQPVTHRLADAAGEIDGAFLEGDRLYELTFNGNSYTLYQNSISPSAKAEKIGSVSVSGPPPIGAQQLQMSIADKVMYAASKFGILVFPLDRSGKPSLITTAQGLPTDVVRSVAALDGKLIIGYGSLWGDDTKGGYLARYDLKTKQCELLASAQRTDGTSPLEGHGAFRVETLLADPSRHRVIMGVFFENILKPQEHSGFKQGAGGIYAIDADAKVSLLSPVGTPSSTEYEILNHSMLHDDRVLLEGNNLVLSLDLKANKLGVIYDGFMFNKPRAISPTLSGKDALFQGYMETSTSAAYCLTADALWAGDPLMRIDLSTHTPILCVDDAVHSSAILLEPLSEGGRVLAVERTSAWLIEPAAKIAN